MGGGKVEARTHQLAETGVLRRLLGRNEVSFPRGASWVERSALPCSDLVLRKYISKLSTHFPAGEMKASVMEGRECGRPEGPESFSHCESACACFWGAGLKLSTVSKGVPNPPRGVNLIDLSTTGPLGQNGALSRVPRSPQT